MDPIKFPSIEQFRHAVENVRQRAQFVRLDETETPIYDETKPLPTLQYRGTVKLHGTNASVVWAPGDVIIPQSRTRALAIGDDNMGFANFVLEGLGPDYWRTFFKRFTPILSQRYELEDKPLTIFGEWVGKGVVKRSVVAVANLDPKIFVVFGLRLGTEEDTQWIDLNGGLKDLINDPKNRIYNIHNFPSWVVDIDFKNLEPSQAKMTEITLEVEKECPVGKALGVEGTGEGVVWKCITTDWEENRFSFKVKGAKHSASKAREPKKLTPAEVEKTDSLADFLDLTVTENRCEQGIAWLKEQGKELTTKSTGVFITWVLEDVIKEESDTMEASGITRKDLNKSLSTKARTWFFARVQADTPV